MTNISAIENRYTRILNFIFRIGADKLNNVLLIIKKQYKINIEKFLRKKKA